MYTLDRLSRQCYDSLQCRETTNPAKRHSDLSDLDRPHVANWRSNFMDMPTSLSMEQQFKLQVLREQVKSLTLDQAQEYLIEVMRQNMVKENILKHWMKKM
jgi:Phycobilisome degradation protein nblA